MSPLLGRALASGKGKYICGSYGICLDEAAPEGCFKYLIADDYDPAKVMPEGFEQLEIPGHTWAVFPCRGPMPEAIQRVNTAIYAEWLPENSDYEIAGNYNIEYYTNEHDYPKGTQDENYYTEIWLPVRARH